MPEPIPERVYRRAVRRDEAAERALPQDVRERVPANGLRQVAAQALQSAGDHSVNASTVLPWLLHALGAPGALVGLLLPVRESLSMLPQAMLTPLVLRARHRKAIFVAGALVQAGAAGAIALVAAIGAGLAAGIAIVAALAVFALGRCLCSIASKDVQGRTIPKGERGQITGLATTAGGVAAITLGIAIRVLGGEDASATLLAWVIAGGAALWVLAALLYSGIREPDGDPWDDDADAPTAPAERPGWARDAWTLLREDAQLRRFVGVRSLLLVSALSPPFLVSLAAASGSGSLVGLGGFVLSAGLAALLGGRVAGRLADRSSRTLMSVGAGVAAAIVALVVAIAALPAFDGASPWGSAVLVVAYFLLALTHTGVRVARKTYVIDMADGDLRTRQVVVANSAMGVVLLVVGAASAALAALGPAWALLLLAALGATGVVAARRLPEVGHA